MSLTPEILRQVIDYSPDTGEFRWKDRSDVGANVNARTRGQVVGYWRPNERLGRWEAAICADYKQIYLGLFDTKEEAVAAYNAAAQRLHGEFARLV